jgi:hypothetical protein
MEAEALLIVVTTDGSQGLTSLLHFFLCCSFLLECNFRLVCFLPIRKKEKRAAWGSADNRNKKAF